MSVEISPPTFSWLCAYSAECEYCRSSPLVPSLQALHPTPYGGPECHSETQIQLCHSKPSLGSPMLQGEIQNGPWQAGLL